MHADNRDVFFSRKVENRFTRRNGPGRVHVVDGAFFRQGELEGGGVEQVANNQQGTAAPPQVEDRMPGGVPRSVDGGYAVKNGRSKQKGGLKVGAVGADNVLHQGGVGVAGVLSGKPQPVVELRLGNMDFCLGEGAFSVGQQAGDMIHMHVRERYVVDIVRRKAQGGQLRVKAPRAGAAVPVAGVHQRVFVAHLHEKGIERGGRFAVSEVSGPLLRACRAAEQVDVCLAGAILQGINLDGAALPDKRRYGSVGGKGPGLRRKEQAQNQGGGKGKRAKAREQAGEAGKRGGHGNSFQGTAASAVLQSRCAAFIQDIVLTRMPRRACRTFSTSNRNEAPMSTLPLLLGLILGFFLVFALCSNVLYWYETLNTPDERVPSPGPGLLPCLLLYLTTFAGYLICFILLPFGPKVRRDPAPLRAGEDASLPPVILVHGLNNNASVWLYFIRVLTRAGYRVSTCVYSSQCAPLERIMRSLDSHVRAVEEGAAGRKPVFICHSLGGVIVRNWLREPGNEDRAGGVMTLGTPHKGSKMAVLAPGALAKNIIPGAALITELLAAPPVAGVPCVAFVSPTDELVLPASALLPPDGWQVRFTKNTAHLGMLFCPATAKMALEELRGMAGRG